MLRFLTLFLLTLICLISCQASHSIPETIAREPENVVATLNTRQVNAPAYVWWEAETPSSTNFPAAEQNPFAPQNPGEASVLSGEKWIGVEGQRSQPLFLEYTVQVPNTGNYDFYTRKFWQHGPFRWRWDDQPWSVIGPKPYLMDEVGMRQFVAVNWVSLGRVPLTAGQHRLRIELTQKDGAAAFDCFVLTSDQFQPRGRLKPDQRFASNDLNGWFIFDPELDQFQASAIDLRSLNEKFAGENGRIQVKGEDFIQEKTGQSVRFWAVNTPMQSIQMDPAWMRYMARSLAKRGVNMVRLHGSIWSEDFRKIDPQDIDRLFAFIAAMKQEGIYTTLSIYFPVWLQLDQNSGFEGYNSQHPFALLFFNRDFQKIYYDWWRSLLTTPNPATGKTLADDPAVAAIELVNEDSYLFWTFEPYKSIPAPQMAILEKQFGTWLVKQYGSLDNAFTTWKNAPDFKPDPNGGDQPSAGRVGILPIYDLVSQPNSRRAQDTARFLTENQKQFFEQAIAFLRQNIQYRGLIYASNWVTADARTLGPLDKYSNTVGDFMDRHGYFEPLHEGDRASFSLNPGDSYRDRSALRLTTKENEQENDFNLPLMDVRYNGMPSTITEINWTMPNRFRADFPLLAAAYGSLQGTDGFFFFYAKHLWESPLDKFTVDSPTILGQFPAAALAYRRGLIAAGNPVADVSLKLNDLYALRGAPVTAPQNLDEFRQRDIPPGQALQGEAASSIDPLAFLVGKVNLRFVQDNGASKLVELSQQIDRSSKVVRSSTNQLVWDYGNGLVTVNAPQVQGATGFLRQASPLQLGDLSLTADLDYGAVLLVALDNQPIAESKRLLLQVASEEQSFGWKASGFPRRTIDRTGTAPTIVRKLAGKVALKRSDAASLKVSALDANGYVVAAIGQANEIALRPDILYYLIEK